MNRDVAVLVATFIQHGLFQYNINTLLFKHIPCHDTHRSNQDLPFRPAWDLVCDKVRCNLGPYLLTTVSPIICILELQWNQEKLVCFLHPSAPHSSAGYRRSRVDKSGLYGRVAPTVYLLVTFAAQPQPHHNYPTYSLNRNHAWQEPPATKVAGLKAIFCLQSLMAMASRKDSIHLDISMGSL